MKYLFVLRRKGKNSRSLGGLTEESVSRLMCRLLLNVNGRFVDSGNPCVWQMTLRASASLRASRAPSRWMGTFIFRETTSRSMNGSSPSACSRARKRSRARTGACGIPRMPRLPVGRNIRRAHQDILRTSNRTPRLCDRGVVFFHETFVQETFTSFLTLTRPSYFVLRLSLNETVPSFAA